MEFTVPQFIEKEAKIVGSLTLKQFIFFGVAVLICVAFYFLLPFWLFIIAALPLLVVSFALSFYKKEGVTLPSLIIGYCRFIFKPKIYLWRKKGTPPKFLQKKEIEKSAIQMEEDEEKKRGARLKISKGSKLSDLHTQVETQE